MRNKLTVKDVCAHYGVTEHTVLVWIRSGELRAVNVARLSGAKKPRWRIAAESLVAFEQARAVAIHAPRAQKKRQTPPGVIEFY